MTYRIFLFFIFFLSGSDDSLTAARCFDGVDDGDRTNSAD